VKGYSLSLSHTCTLGRTPLDEGSARGTCLYLYNTQYAQEETSMSAAGFEPAITRSVRQQAYAATGIEPSLISDRRIFKELRTLGRDVNKQLLR